MHVKYEGAQYSITGTLDFELIIIDPCLDTALVFPEAQVDPPDYYY